MTGVSPAQIAALRERETEIYTKARPKTRAALEQGTHFLDGVPMHWMKDWPQPFPMLVAKAQGANLTDIDGITLDDFCLGDTGSMFGHSPEPVARAIMEQATNGLTYMLPTVAALEVGDLLSRTFGDMRWQIATTATDANRFALRVARAVTGRAKVLVFNGCYHGTIDDAMVVRTDGKTVNRPGLVGQVNDLSQTAVSCEFNDLAMVEEALAQGDIAAILTEPVMKIGRAHV